MPTNSSVNVGLVFFFLLLFRIYIYFFNIVFAKSNNNKIPSDFAQLCATKPLTKDDVVLFPYGQGYKVDGFNVKGGRIETKEKENEDLLVEAKKNNLQHFSFSELASY